MTDNLADRVRHWIAQDPDPDSRTELQQLLDALPATEAELADRFSGPLTFGTAGLRGPLRAGPNGMNLAVVRQAAAGLVNWLTKHEPGGLLVIGYDARRGSHEFALETARVATGSGMRAALLPRPLPTPVLAYAVRAMDAVAGVMVTASHNPPQDNGYKVYLGEHLGGPLGAGAQIVPPADQEIEAEIRAVKLLSEVPLGHPGTVLGEDILDSYLTAAAAVVQDDQPKDLAVAYTPLHGVGGKVLGDAFLRAGFALPAVVPAQAEPDGAFPTVAFPNPEEPGAMDLVLALAAERRADIVIANDPDADRCAVAVPVGNGNGWRMLRGDEVGVLLADHLMRLGRTGTYATTIVSSSMLRAMAAKRGVGYAETLTGFKWLARAAPDLAYGYEEALGICVAPWMARDKDGITAALLVAELAAGLKAELRTLTDRLDELAAEFGLYVTDQLSVRVDDLDEIGRMMAHLRAKLPTSLLDEPVTSTEDLLDRPAESASDVIILRTDTARVVVRPSGTEPKLKAYLEVVEPVSEADVTAARGRAAATIRALRTEVAAALGIWSVSP
ncbi:phospho-sugar mutase [Catellatospora citrea]|uniref:Phosphomannomutase n=1 Tax=Catellatospora citrea TaxID=53366 RepID=A0A8J3KHV5_9ACTN|nr:phospho-sugar mutase [Catellatospora citrea]RKE09393.1 phosphomannomutase [Catellatospora citrea]GIF97350.1 phosphomannomutase [Catellatospora citrea]